MQSIQLSIPTPCHQNWDKMTPTEQGRFCNACAKQVVDFTTMSDGEVLNYFVNKNDENVCGRTLPNQLNRVLEAPKPIVPSKLWYWKYAAAGLLFFSKADELNAQSVTPYTPQEINTIQKGLQGKVGEVAVSTNKVVSGKITDKDGYELSFASVRIKGTNRGTTADANGEFKITVDFENKILEISSFRFETKSIDVSNSTNFIIRLKMREQVLQNDIVIGMIGSVVHTPKPQKYTASIKVKDTVTNKIIKDVILYVKEEDDLLFDTINLKNGTYKHKIKNIKKYEEYTIKASKEGYESKTIVITKENFNKRKGVFEIVLEKNKLITKVVNNEKITLRGSIITKFSTDPIYVVDGIIDPNAKNIKPNDIEKIEVLKGASATVLFGQDGTNGVIIITTKKQKVKKDTLPTPNYKLMDEVIVKGDANKKITSQMLGSVSVVSGEMLMCTTSGMNIKASKTDTIKQKIQNFFSPIKTYPNPVKKGEMLTLSFPNKNKFYTIQIINAVGVVMLQNKRQDGLVSTDAYTKSITQQIPIATTWSSGYYFINILNEQGKPIAKSSFLVL